MFTKIISALLALWYCMSIIGFDVHTCSRSGRSFVATFMTGLDCSDIHPDHCCSHSDCCADHATGNACCSSEESISAPSCCTNDFHVLLLTGTSGQEDTRHYDGCICGHQICDLMPSEIRTDNSYTAFYRTRSVFEPGLLLTGNVQSFLGIWRI